MAETGRFSLKGKTAMVTGASSGLGVAMCEALADAGANVVLAARRVDMMESVARGIEERGGKTLVQACDVADSASVANAVATAWDAFGRVDILVNNAGVADAGIMPERATDEQFQRTMQVNVNGTFYGCREVAVRQLADGRGGSIINISSIMGLAGHHFAPVGYQTSKGAVIQMTRNLALTWADRGVRVNCIAPGWYPSEMTNDWLAVPEFLERFQNQSPMVRVGDPDELSGALIWLASDASSFVTGQIIAVDGGVSASNGGFPYTPRLLELQSEGYGEAGTRVMPQG